MEEQSVSGSSEEIILQFGINCPADKLLGATIEDGCIRGVFGSGDIFKNMSNHFLVFDPIGEKQHSYKVIRNCFKGSLGRSVKLNRHFSKKRIIKKKSIVKIEKNQDQQENNNIRFARKRIKKIKQQIKIQSNHEE